MKQEQEARAHTVCHFNIQVNYKVLHSELHDLARARLPPRLVCLLKKTMVSFITTVYWHIKFRQPRVEGKVRIEGTRQSLMPLRIFQADHEENTM